MVITAKGLKNTTKYLEEMKTNNVHKMYLARVFGDFKEEFLEVDFPIYCSSRKNSKHAVAVTPEQIKESKTAKTGFQKLWYDPETNTSLLKCLPETGRTHQIRVHLQFLGHPIINDINYGGKVIGNPIYKRFIASSRL